MTHAKKYLLPLPGCIAKDRTIGETRLS